MMEKDQFAKAWPRRRRGYTLVEMMAGLILLSIAVTGMIMGLRFSIRSAMVSDAAASALASARLEMESLFAKGFFTDPALTTKTHTYTRTNYTVVYTVTDISTTVKQIAMTVSHKTMGGGTTSVRLTSQLAKALR